MNISIELKRPRFQISDHIPHCFHMCRHGSYRKTAYEQRLHRALNRSLFGNRRCKSFWLSISAVPIQTQKIKKKKKASTS